MEVGRLTQKFEFRDSFGLPARALDQFHTIGEGLRALDVTTAEQTREAADRLEPLHNTLLQLESIYELAAIRLSEERQTATSKSVWPVLVMEILLVLVASPLVARLFFS